MAKFVTNSLNIALEAVFNRDAQGNIWSAAGLEPSFWQRYLAVFETIVVVARVREVPDSAPPHLTIPRGHITFVELPYYRGLAGFLRRLFRLFMHLKQASSRSGYFLLRLPGAIGTLLGFMCMMRRKPFAVEMVGDLYDVLSGEGFSIMARVMRGPFMQATKLLCRSSIGNTYVTERTLQQRYPSGSGIYSDSISSIDLSPGHISDSAMTYYGHRPLRLFFCGSLAQLYKGLDVLIEAVAQLTGKGRDIVVVVAGDGRFRAQLEKLARDRGVSDCFSFRGQISRAEVFVANDQTDIFVMPSRTEGLPRALVEAMARGKCCIGTHAGGIPELLSEDALVPPGEANALAKAIEYAMDNPHWMTMQAERNLAFARKFSVDILGPRRTAFYEEVKRRTEGAIL